MKGFILPYLCLLIHLIGLPANSQTYRTLTADDVNIEGTTIISCKDLELLSYIEIPEQIGGIKIEEIGEKAFEGGFLRGVKIAGSVKKISRRSFCSNYLHQIELKDGIEEICDSAFACQLKKADDVLFSLVIPQSVKRIGNYAFMRCIRIGGLQLNNGIESIGRSAFEEDHITELIVPEGVTHIGNNAFSFNNMNDLALPESLTNLDGFANNQLTKIEIRPTVKKISDNAFSSNKIEKLVIPASVDTIGKYAFATNNIKNIKLSEGLKAVDNNAFYGASSDTLTIPVSLTKVGTFAFSGTYGTVIYKGETDSIPTNMFMNIYCENIIVTSTIKSIGNSAFSNVYSHYMPDIQSENPTTYVRKTIPLWTDGVEYVGKWAYAGTWCRELMIEGKGNDLILDDGVFKGCIYLQNLTIGPHVTSIGCECFAGPDIYRSLSVNLTNATDLIDIKPYAFADANKSCNIKLPLVNGTKWVAYQDEPTNVISDVPVNIIADPSLGYVRIEVSEQGEDDKEGPKPTGVEDLHINRGNEENNNTTYDLYGRRAKNGSAGLQIKEGRLFLNKH